jgi:hypothetical protein
VKGEIRRKGREGVLPRGMEERRAKEQRRNIHYREQNLELAFEIVRHIRGDIPRVAW